MITLTKDSVARCKSQQFPIDTRTAAELAKALGGHATGGQWIAKCPAHEDKRPSLSIRDGAEKPIFNCLAGCDFRDVQDALVDLGLWPEFRPGEQRERSEPRPRPRLVLTGPSADELRKLERAYQLWAYAVPWLSGTPAELYLQRRGIWKAIDPIDNRLRFARLRHPQTREEGVPCLIVPRHDVRAGFTVACHRIYLTEDGQKYPRKPFVNPDGVEGFADAKISLGIARDSWAILHSQERRRWETIGFDEIEHVDTTDRLVLAEGVETALSAAILYERPAWAKCSGFPAEMWLPDHIRDVLICADNDPPIKNGKPRVTSEDRANKLAAFILGTGRRCAVDVPETEKWDANDVLLAQMEAA